MNPADPSARSPSDFGLIAWLEETRVRLPLKGVECRFEVTGAIACVELDQIYHQSTNRALDCTYMFPLPAGAAVHRCELHVNGRVIRARVEERETARRIQREQKAAGRRTALVEMERENLFTLTLGNVQPGDVIVVRFAWFQTLDRSGAGLRLLVPTCPGVRYIPGQPLLRRASGLGIADDTDSVPDASCITPPRIDSIHPDAAYLSIVGRLSSADIEPGTASSPSHPLCIRETEGVMTTELFGHDAVPDRDFVMVWREPRARQLTPQAWRWSEGGDSYALVELRAPEVAKVAEGDLHDFYFLVDRSGSMEGMKWHRTCDALQAFVGLLGPTDRVSITLFDSEWRDFAEAPMPAPRVMADRGFQSMKSLGTSGGTELLPAAHHVLAGIATHSEGRRTTVVLITDGQVGNERAILDEFRRAPLVRVHTFGIDTAVNDAFLKSLARQHRGGCWLQTPDDDITGMIAGLGDRLRRPVVTDIFIRGPWQANVARCPDLHAGEIVTIALKGDAAEPLEIGGRLPDGVEYNLSLQHFEAGNEAIRLLWAQERIAELRGEGKSREAIALAKQHNLICEGAAFIAWDEAEQCIVAQAGVVQPSMEMANDLLHSQTVCYFEGSIKYMSAGIGSRHLTSEQVASVREFLHAEHLSDTAARVFSNSTLDDTGSEPLSVLHEAMILLTASRARELLPQARKVLELSFRNAVRISPEAVKDWTAYARLSGGPLSEALISLLEGGAPEAVIDQLAEWVIATGVVDPQRIKKIEDFGSSDHRLPFAEHAYIARWRGFVTRTFSEGSLPAVVTLAWLAACESGAARNVHV